MTMKSSHAAPRGLSRREFLQNCALATAVLAAGSLTGCTIFRKSKGPARLVQSLDQDWRFGGKFAEAALAPEFDDSAFENVTLPHCVTKLSWQNWDPTSWETQWIYRRHFARPEGFENRRVFLHFDGVMVGATPVLNGHALPQHLGAYLPFEYEVTDLLKEKDNILAVEIDSRWSDVPPEGNPKGVNEVDFLEPGGIPRSVSLRAVPMVYLSDVFAKPVSVLDANRRVIVSCTIDAAVVPSKPVSVTVDLLDGDQHVATISQPVTITQAGVSQVELTLAGLADLKLWDLDTPQLYRIVSTLSLGDQPVHDYETRIGLREARFEVDGFYLNGRRVQIFGLNRHEVYPFVGFAMPPRVMRRDAEILKHQLNCNMVRCSHYPQTEAFLDACDELGLLVWEEIPGWGYLGDAPWKDVAVRNTGDMIRRDRNHASIIIWGVRVNESKNDPALYERTTSLARSLDDSRPMSGAMVGGLHSLKDWKEDVFAYNDYDHNDKTGAMQIKAPLEGVPYFLTEAVGQVVGIGPSLDHVYRRNGEPALQAKQAMYHALAHEQAARDKHNLGVVAWCAFEYASSVKAAYKNHVKYPGVSDVFRIPKLGASFYLAQVSPKVRAVIEPNFYWNFGPKTPKGPGKGAAIFSNCDRLELFINGTAYGTLHPEREKYPHLAYPPFITDLEIDGTAHPELRMDGYVGDQMVLSRTFSSDPAQDQFVVTADDAELTADGADATRVVFQVADKYGAPRALAGGTVTFDLTGPGELVGDNPFGLDDTGGIAAVWVKAAAGGTGVITLKATHSSLGQKAVTVMVKAGTMRNLA